MKYTKNDSLTGFCSVSLDGLLNSIKHKAGTIRYGQELMKKKLNKEGLKVNLRQNLNFFLYGRHYTWPCRKNLLFQHLFKWGICYYSFVIYIYFNNFHFSYMLCSPIFCNSIITQSNLGQLGIVFGLIYMGSILRLIYGYNNCHWITSPITI